MTPVSLPETAEEQAAAFRLLANALTHQWVDGSWTWWNRTPSGGPKRSTRGEAVADLLAWAARNPVAYLE